ncbi:hypothetical protein K523DRAFT_135654 [Schizophyllum commune Tattone D]|nr:hypothetical protein K523DRAFT_135654 [Schizophyllum commune Tattone D]
MDVFPMVPSVHSNQRPAHLALNRHHLLYPVPTVPSPPEQASHFRSFANILRRFRLEKVPKVRQTSDNRTDFRAFCACSRLASCQHEADPGASH